MADYHPITTGWWAGGISLAVGIFLHLMAHGLSAKMVQNFGTVTENYDAATEVFYHQVGWGFIAFGIILVLITFNNWQRAACTKNS